MPTLLQEPLVLNPTGKKSMFWSNIKRGDDRPKVKHDTRYASQEGDANGVVRGQYAYLDPNYQWQQVSCLIVNFCKIDCSLELLSHAISAEPI